LYLTFAATMADARPWKDWVGTYKVQSNDIGPTIALLKVEANDGSLILHYKPSVCYADYCEWKSALAIAYTATPTSAPYWDTQAIMSLFKLHNENIDIDVTIMLDNHDGDSVSAHVYTNYGGGPNVDSAWHRTFVKEPGDPPASIEPPPSN